MQPDTATGLVIGAVLAAGAGSRYGMPKILAENGRWLELAVAALDRGGCDEIYVTQGAAPAEILLPARGIDVARWRGGVSESVRAVLDVAHPRTDVAGVLIHLVDLPSVGPEVVGAVLHASERRRSALVRATFGGRPGHPVYIGSDHFGPLSSVLAGDRGAGPYLAARGDVIEVPCEHLGDGCDHDYRP
ncbi:MULTISPECIES: NTP transferase domain-containing protein [Mycobacteroides]|uniref:nucleotidyltransferase family protein n=1 Tax=Mycobacteroides TaxID=670516 RepID=UPI0007151FCA|nr:MULTISPECIES: NTP transferase domain-containing protein [Mycobacteroides]KRQ23573.1 molybdopterin-guanine dinucleotide biosynthesis protein MobA [Mycobacteroides sp. H092]KRQ24027.1 molybdopterin-guanine dinucleotide biosynthesis protein MobA [Mycobacteroides sp. H003]KRQ43027.1 molybdopterin-guanine dinucleotide biosynthesis protein MobA [Mycobacteroides sp. H101]KRQ48205.1 molybdopterin-guanine dinucleotide biosynthesis protein MobA [Mycobacteroides sp. H063]KRQ57831.1 molybdopterin-guani